jgi:hypothetical protein
MDTVPYINDKCEYAMEGPHVGFRFATTTAVTQLTTTLFRATGFDRRVFTLSTETIIKLNEVLEAKTVSKADFEAFGDLIVFDAPNRVLVFMFRYVTTMRRMGDVEWRINIDRLRDFVPDEDEQIDSLKAMANLLEFRVVETDDTCVYFSETRRLSDEILAPIVYKKNDDYFSNWMGAPRRHVFVDAPDHWFASEDFKSFRVIRRAHWGVSVRDALKIVSETTGPIVWLGRASLATGVFALGKSACVRPHETTEPPPKRVLKVKSIVEAESKLTNATYVIVSSTEIAYVAGAKRGIWYSVATQVADTNRARFAKNTYPHTAHFNVGSVERFKELKCPVDWVVYVGKRTTHDYDFLYDACNVGLMIVE